MSDDQKIDPDLYAKTHAQDVEALHRSVAEMIQHNAKVAAACRAVLSDSRLLQITRAHKSARPTDRNPAWLNTHNDLGYVLRLIELLEAFK